MKKIAFIGNCQTLIIASMLKRLNKDIDIKFYVLNKFTDAFWLNNMSCHLNFKENLIYSRKEFMKFIRECDSVYSFPTDPSDSTSFNSKSIKKFLPQNSKLNLTSGIFYEGNKKSKQKLIKREENGHYLKKNKNLEKLPYDNFITSTDLLEKFSFEELIQNPEKPFHGSSLFHLEMLRKICVLENIDFFSEEDYIKICEEKIPYGIVCKPII
jgi:hypothetical protein